MTSFDESEARIHFAEITDEETLCGKNPKQVETTNSPELVSCRDCMKRFPITFEKGE